MNEAGGGEPKQQFELPQPAETADRGDEAVEHQRPAGQEVGAGKQAAPPAIQPPPAIPDVPDVQAPALPMQDDNITPVVSSKTTKIQAADKDLIEKEWVDKAKQLVAETRSDPFKQKNEMSKIKADYIGKRYKKNIKTEPAWASYWS